MRPELESSGPRRSPLTRAPALIALLGVLGLLGLLAYGLASRAPDATVDNQLARGHAPPAPGFNLKVLERGALGQPLSRRLGPALSDGGVDLRELRGVPVVLNFWASWCPPCRTEAPLLENGWRAARPQGVAFVGLDQQDVTGDARDFMRAYRVDYLNVRDPGGDTSHRWGVTGLPETFFISAQGRVVDHVIGALSTQQLQEGMAAARRGSVAGTQQGGARQATR
jgi:cytochrome c biogenesis protein CcmG/thiol:disulfide interchange protein DsbE